jgi:5-methylthioadenosine/S-adenosylhomocysteine deaminase
MDREVGSIAVGKRADLVLMRHENLNHMPPADPFASIIMHSRPHDIDTVIIAGTRSPLRGSAVA